MIIGILTYHRTHNYGALLQAVATRCFLQKLGHEVYYVDYWPDYHRDNYSLFDRTSFKRSGLLKKLSIIYHTMVNYKGKKRRVQTFEPFIAKYIVPYCKPYTEGVHYDVVLYGSDQIWRKQHRDGNKFNSIYFGTNRINADKHITYAASMGKINLSDTDKLFLKDSLKKFDSLMVREDDLCQVLDELGFNDAKVVIDPTLLLSSEDWNNAIPFHKIIPEPYVLLYQLSDSISRVHAEEFAKKRNLKLVVLGSKYDYRHPNDITDATPEDFISLIKYADIVLAGSYHGLVFSLNYNKNVYCSFKVNSKRAETILKAVGLEDRMVEANTKLPTIDSLIDWTVINEELNKLRNTSISELVNSLGNE